MEWSVKVPAGYMLTMLPPGTSQGAETNPECNRVAHRSQGSAHFSRFANPFTMPARRNAGAPMYLRKGALDVCFAKKMAE